jgi:hypothetical protein
VVCKPGTVLSVLKPTKPCSQLAIQNRLVFSKLNPNNFLSTNLNTIIIFMTLVTRDFIPSPSLSTGGVWLLAVSGAVGIRHCIYSRLVTEIEAVMVGQKNYLPVQ